MNPCEPVLGPLCIYTIGRDMPLIFWYMSKA